MLPFWLAEVLFWALVAANAVLAYSLRRNPLFCLATLAFLPFVPAALRYLASDQTIVLPIGAEGVRVFVIAVMSFLPVWIGFGAGLLFDWLNAGIPVSAPEAEGGLGSANEGNWREILSQRPNDVETS